MQAYTTTRKVTWDGSLHDLHAICARFEAAGVPESAEIVIGNCGYAPKYVTAKWPHDLAQEPPECSHGQ